MLERLKRWNRDRCAINALLKQQRAIQESYAKYIAEAKSHEEKQILKSEEASHWFDLEEERKSIIDRQLIHKALRCGVPIPQRPPHDEENEHWEPGPSGQWLTQRGEKYLKDEIRKEKKERRDMILGWLPLVTAVAGLLAVLTGLLALLLALSSR